MTAVVRNEHCHPGSGVVAPWLLCEPEPRGLAIALVLVGETQLRGNRSARECSHRIGQVGGSRPASLTCEFARARTANQ